MEIHTNKIKALHRKHAHTHTHNPHTHAGHTRTHKVRNVILDEDIFYLPLLKYLPAKSLFYYASLKFFTYQMVVGGRF